MESYVGEIRAFAGNYAPQDWALCDGSQINISGNESLFSLIGTTYGGDGVNNFKLPDLKGRLMVNRGQLISGGIQGHNYVLGEKNGAEFVTLNVANLPAHTHTLNASTQDATTNTPDNNILAAPTDTGTGFTVEMYLPANTSGTTNVNLSGDTLGAAYGGGQAHDNLMPFLCISYIICINGLYPSFN
ncbi:MAG: tail fiber protein [Bacteroidales bacterium]|nr:tail fiber protein [Bacteroidales bacterium]